MEKPDLLERTEQFSLRVIALVKCLPPAKDMNIISGQLLRAATSVGANYRAARRAKSKRDFINKLKIVEEEADETLFWLGLVQKSGKVKGVALQSLLQEANELVAIFVASLKTAKLKKEEKK